MKMDNAVYRFENTPAQILMTAMVPFAIHFWFVKITFVAFHFHAMTLENCWVDFKQEKGVNVYTLQDFRSITCVLYTIP